MKPVDSGASSETAMAQPKRTDLYVAATLVEDVLTAGVGVVDDPASFAIASGMTYTAKGLFIRHTVSLWSRFSGRFVAGSGLMTAPAIAQPDSTGLLDE